MRPVALGDRVAAEDEATFASRPAATGCGVMPPTGEVTRPQDAAGRGRPGGLRRSHGGLRRGRRLRRGQAGERRLTRSGDEESVVPPTSTGWKLLDRMRDALRARPDSPRTEEAYTACVMRFVRIHGLRPPETMGEPEESAFLTDLAVTEGVAASTQTQALSALLFLYRNVLGRELGTWCVRVVRGGCRWSRVGPR